MQNLVLYRKYRPRTFKEIVGQEHIVKILTNALISGKIAHAYLFAGPRGTGKTTVARLLAKSLNCSRRQQPATDNQQPDDAKQKAGSREQEVRASTEPCNQCPACQEINQGRSLDLIEIDAASNRGIDEIRELRDGVRFTPVRLKYKVFIIDEVHQLTKEAFNALLKTLEEPPPHVIFILATTEIHKLLQTIISRCQRFNFNKVTVSQIVERLEKISAAEKIKVAKETLNLIALQADGAFRDAESLLDQIIVIEDKNITLEEVKEILGIADENTIKLMVEYLFKKDLVSALDLLNKILKQGYDLGQFAKALIYFLRKIIILKVNPDLIKIIGEELTLKEKEELVSLAKNFSFDELLSIIDIFLKAEQNLKSCSIPSLPLELAMIEIIKNTN